jgi:hypothetical protein
MVPMKTTLALGAALVAAFAVSLAESWYLAVALELVAFVVWCQVHHVLSKRERLRAFGTEEDQ